MLTQAVDVKGIKLLVAKLDPAADGEGIPAELWQGLLQSAASYQPDRILAAIDVFAESEGRMKWATNKRLHFELGVIKSIQTLAEVRITDVIKALTRGADSLSQEMAANIQEPASATAPVVEQTPPPPPKPAVVPQEKPAPAVTGMDAFELLIDAAPEESEPPLEPEPPPWSEQPKPEPTPEPPTTPAAEDTFHQDPLVQAALEQFEGKFVS